jgi:DNA-3-methyladenine glycosylase II
LGGALQERSKTESLIELPEPELFLFSQDPILAQIIATDSAYWPSGPTEDPIWGLIRIVVAQQISTRLACRFAERLKSACPQLIKPTSNIVIDLETFRAIGISNRRAHCCLEIIRRSNEIRTLCEGDAVQQALSGIKGIGPWTISVFRIMVLREPDEFPAGDIGLQRAIEKLYGRVDDLKGLSDRWRPFRSVACWYLWRTLGNEQLG